MILITIEIIVIKTSNNKYEIDNNVKLYSDTTNPDTNSDDNTDNNSDININNFFSVYFLEFNASDIKFLGTTISLLKRNIEKYKNT